MYDDMVSS